MIDKNNPLNYYDLIIDINSFLNLVKFNNNYEWGWNITINNNFNYEEAIKDEYISIGVLGNKKTGKTFILNKLGQNYGYSFPNGFNINTKGISVKYPNREHANFVIFDTAGFDRPLKGINEYKLEDIKHSEKTIKIINDIERDREITEYFIQKFILKYSNIIIIVVNQLSSSEQELLEKIKKENKRKRIFVVHNLYNLETKWQVEDYIERTFLKSLTFRLRPNRYVSFSNEVQDYINNTFPKSLTFRVAPYGFVRDYKFYSYNEKAIYYHEEFGSSSIEHLILGKEGSESGNYYNKNTLNYLERIVNGSSYLRKVPTIENVIKLLDSISHYIFVYSIPKDKIKYENGKLYIDNFDRPIIFKKFNTSCPICYNRFNYPKYNFYVVKSYKEIPELQNNIIESDEIRDLNELEGRPIYVLQIELPGLIKYKNKPSFNITSGGKTVLVFSGVKEMNNIEIIKEEEKNLYTNTRKEGKYSLYFEVSSDTVYFETTYLGNTYEDGLFTFYYYGYKDEIEIEFGW